MCIRDRYIKTGVGLANFRQHTSKATSNFIYGYTIGYGIDRAYKNSRKYTFTGELLFTQKGGFSRVAVPVYDSTGQVSTMMTETFPIHLSYLSLTCLLYTSRCV